MVFQGPVTWFTRPEPEGVQCPRCGCRHAERIDGAGTWERRRCRHCGREWTIQISADRLRPEAAPSGEAGPDPSARCPACGSRDTRVASTRPKVRWHKCRACGRSFKTVRSES